MYARCVPHRKKTASRARTLNTSKEKPTRYVGGTLRAANGRGNNNNTTKPPLLLSPFCRSAFVALPGAISIYTYHQRPQPVLEGQRRRQRCMCVCAFLEEAMVARALSFGGGGGEVVWFQSSRTTPPSRVCVHFNSYFSSSICPCCLRAPLQSPPPSKGVVVYHIART